MSSTVSSMRTDSASLLRGLEADERTVKLEVQWAGPADAAPTKFIATLTPNSERDLPYRALNDYQFGWTFGMSRANPLQADSSIRQVDRSDYRRCSVAHGPTDIGRTFRRLAVTLLAPSDRWQQSAPSNGRHSANDTARASPRQGRPPRTVSADVGNSRWRGAAVELALWPRALRAPQARAVKKWCE